MKKLSIFMLLLATSVLAQGQVKQFNTRDLTKLTVEHTRQMKNSDGYVDIMIIDDEENLQDSISSCDSLSQPLGATLTKNSVFKAQDQDVDIILVNKKLSVLEDEGLRKLAKENAIIVISTDNSYTTSSSITLDSSHTKIKVDLDRAIEQGTIMRPELFQQENVETFFTK